MATLKIAKFFFGTEITLTSNKFDFDEGGGELTFTIPLGVYSLTGLAAEVEEGLNAAGDNTYTVTFDRSTRLFTISADAVFDILIDTGSNASSGSYSVIGFTGTTDLTGATDYSANQGAGSEYLTQYPPQDYVAPGFRREKGDASVNTSASGLVEVISFGDVQYIEMNLLFISDLAMGWTPFRNDPNGVQNALDFLTFATKRGPIEFMPDKDVPATFYQVTLESTSADRKGTKFVLREETGKNLPGIYKTGRLEFRITE